jgi:hypothetical protein
MILDGQLNFDGYPTTTFSFNQAAATYNSANIIDLHMAGIPVLANNQGARDIGIGDDPAMKLLVQVISTLTSGGAATLQVALQGATDNGSGSPNAFSTWWQSPAYALATLVAGARLYDMDMPRPPAGIAIPRFLRMQYIIGAAAGTGGTLASFIVLDRMDQIYAATNNAIMGGYPAGVTVAN